MAGEKILVVESDLTFAGKLKRNLRKLGYDADDANDLIEAKAKLAAAQPDLSLIDVDILRDSDSSHAESQLGLELAKEIGGSDTDIIIMADHDHVDLYREVNKIRSCRLEKKFELAEVLKLRGIVEDGISGSHTRKLTKLSVKIDLSSGRLDYDIRGEFTADGMGGIKPETIRRRIKSSEEVAAMEEGFEDSLKLLGELLMRDIIQDNGNLRDDFYAAIATIGTGQKLSMVFNIRKGSQELHKLIFEALYDKDDFLMLHQPIYRSVEGSTHKKPLFADERDRLVPINILLVASNISGQTRLRNERDVSLGNLNQVDREVNELKEELEKLNIVGRVEVINSPHATKENVQNKMAEQINWHILHYAGHSFYDGENSAFFFRKASGGIIPRAQLDALYVEELGNLVEESSIRLVFLSSCQSAEMDFVSELVKRMIPAVVGFRWVVDDKQAKNHALTFYKNLFERRSLEQAFVETRRQMRSTYFKQRIWVSPVLVVKE
ncbi:MAG: CHAT domain-containing protein [Candidatus Bathyarchaeia archaeon]